MQQYRLDENFEVGDLKGILQDWLHIDQFRSKIGSDDKNIVVSFGVFDKAAANDLVDFLERGYDFILDADISAKEISPRKYLVFAEFMRRRRFPEQLLKGISDLRAASKIDPKSWTFRYMKQKTTLALTAENLRKVVPLSPKKYRDLFVKKPIDDLKVAAGIETPGPGISNDPELNNLQNLAGLT